MNYAIAVIAGMGIAILYLLAEVWRLQKLYKDFEDWRDANQLLQNNRQNQFYKHTSEMKNVFDNKFDMIKRQSDTAYHLASNAMRDQKRVLKVWHFEGKTKQKQKKPLLPKQDFASVPKNASDYKGTVWTDAEVNA